jgi:Tol biopolymer transport system component
MTLPTGTKLGPYEILSPLGAGGMGEVYRARDTRLDRTVAIKVLPRHLASSSELRQRFEREAKTIASLSHPHICALHDVGREGETEYLVMEYLEGETLAARLAKGALPLDQTLRYGIEIADALDKAHRSGIVHRDLKPANVMLTKSGVKLLDFGLAKALSPPRPTADVTGLPTAALVTDLTQEGVILGTIQYMAPEQIEGSDAGALTDIFAFGAVLYEMATGRKAFQGKSRASLITAILRDEPGPVSQVQPMAPAMLNRLVRKCLAKDPEDRWQSARDVRSELEWIRDDASGGQAAPVPGARGRMKSLIPWLVAAGLAAAFVAELLTAHTPAPSGIGGAIRFEVQPPEGAVLLHQNPVGTFFSVSPDGRQITYVASSASLEGDPIQVRALDSLVSRPIPGTEGGGSPFWSPDGASLAFFADGKLKKVALSGGPAITICNAGHGATGTWGPDGTIIFSQWGDESGALFRVPASGGEPTAATRLDASRKEHWQQWPTFLPDGRRFLYLSTSGEAWPQGRREIYVGTLGSLDARRVASVDSQFAYASPGFLLFAREGALFAQRFDPAAARVLDEPRLIVPEIQTYRPTGVASLSSSATAPILAFYVARDSARLVWLDRTGKEVETVGSGVYLGRSLRLSPDGKRLALSVFDKKIGTTDLWVQDLQRGTQTRVTFDPSSEFSAVWSPDGLRLIYSSDRGGKKPDLYQVNLKDLKSDLLLPSIDPKSATDISPDGRFLLYNEGSLVQRDIRVLPLSGEKRPFAFVATPFDENDARFSPDGRFVAYASAESGKSEIYVRRFPLDPERWQISRSGGAFPRWRPDGKEIYFVAAGNLMAAPVRLGKAVESDAPAMLFAVADAADYDVAPDGRILVALTGAHPAGIQVVANWTSERKP